jgi:hypothetical protein
VRRNMFADLEGGVKTRGAKTDGDRLAIEEKGFEIVMLLNHVYAGSQYKITPDNIATCLRLGAKYEVPGLTDACHAWLDRLELGTSTLPGWLSVAPGYGLARFTTRCVEFAACNLQTIINQRKYSTPSCSYSAPRIFTFGLRGRSRAMQCTEHDITSVCTILPLQGGGETAGNGLAREATTKHAGGDDAVTLTHNGFHLFGQTGQRDCAVRCRCSKGGEASTLVLNCRPVNVFCRSA